jgi:hypothetical protein
MSGGKPKDTFTISVQTSFLNLPGRQAFRNRCRLEALRHQIGGASGRWWEAYSLVAIRVGGRH